MEQRHRTSRLAYRLTLVGSIAAVSTLGLSLLLPAIGPVAPAHHASAAVGASHGAAVERAPVTVIFWNGDWSQDQYPLFQRIIDRFNKSQTAIHVKMLPNPYNDTKLLAAITAGQSPDVVEMNPTNVGAWAFRGALTDLGPYIKTSTNFDLKSIVPGVVAAGTLHGKIYALGSLFDGLFLYWNKDMFKAAGLDPNTPPRTIAQLDVLNAKLTVQNKNGTFKSMGMVPSGLFTWGNVFGGSFYNDQTRKITANDPKIVKALAWETAFYKRYGPTNVSKFASSSFGTGPMAGNGPFGFKQAAMDVNGEYMAGNYYTLYAKDLHFGLAPLPTIKAGDQPASPISANSTAIPTGSKHPKEAWQFMTYLLNADNTAFLANQVDNMPQSAELYSDAGINRITKPSLRTLMRIFRTERQFYFPVIEDSTYLSNQLSLAEGNATLGKMSPKQALDQATTNAQQDLNKATGNHS